MCMTWWTKTITTRSWSRAAREMISWWTMVRCGLAARSQCAVNPLMRTDNLGYADDGEEFVGVVDDLKAGASIAIIE